MIRLYLIYVLLFLTSTGFSTNYYIAPYGNDNSGNGSIVAPFATLEKACNYVKAGDTVFIRGGIYNTKEQLINNKTDGTAVNPIVFMAYPGEEPIIDGTNISLSNNGSLLFIGRWTSKPIMKYIVIDGISIRNSEERGISFYKTDYLTIKNCKAYNIERRAIGGYGHYVIIEKNEVYNSVLENEKGFMEPGGWAMNIFATTDYETGARSQNIIIRNNYVHNCWGEGIGPGEGSDNVLIEGNTVKDVYSVGIYVDKATNTTIRNNHVYNTDPNWYRNGAPSPGISMANEISFGTIYSPVSKINICNNLISNVRKGIGFWFDGSNSEKENSYSNILIAHNVIFNPTSYGIYIDNIPNENTQPTGCRIHNNIIGFGAKQSEIFDLNAWQVSHNNWLREIPAFAGIGAISADPLFENPGIENTPEGFRLTAGSPAIAAGIKLTEVSTDFWGAKQLSPPSIGIHAFGTTDVSDISNHNNFMLYPNPAHDYVYIQMNHNNNNPVMIHISDLSGKVIYNHSISNETGSLNISHLISGVYIIHIKNGTDINTQKLIIKY